jgi:signal transduction histidine kinase
MEQYKVDWASWLTVLDSVDARVSIHSPEGAILHANPKLQEQANGKGELLGRLCDEAFPSGSCPHAEAFAERRPVHVEIRTNGDSSGSEVTVVPLFDSAGGPQGFVRIERSFSAPIATQVALLKAERFASLGRMMAGIAHDIGTPLNIISGYAEYLLMRSRNDASGNKELTAILEQTRRVAEYIRILLDLTRPSNAKSDAIELKGFLEDSLELMGSHLRKANVSASLTCKTAPPVIYGDGARLRQAFFNLVLDAGKRVGPGGRVELAIEQFPDEKDFIAVTIIAAFRDGRIDDGSESFDGHLWAAEDIGLALAREILDECRAKVASLTLAERGVALVVYLPKTAIKQNEAYR